MAEQGQLQPWAQLEGKRPEAAGRAVVLWEGKATALRWSGEGSEVTLPSKVSKDSAELVPFVNNSS